jgi:hypothetical protein
MLLAWTPTYLGKEGPRHQDHVVMNVQVLSNSLAQFHHNKQTAIARAKGDTNLEWDKFQVAMEDTPKIFKPTLIMLTFGTILELLGMTTWGMRSIPFNV